jgi:hypothetical protein
MTFTAYHRKGKMARTICKKQSKKQSKNTENSVSARRRGKPFPSGIRQGVDQVAQ